jgi:hypothetical protein
LAPVTPDDQIHHQLIQQHPTADPIHMKNLTHTLKTLVAATALTAIITLAGVAHAQAVPSR